MYVGVCVCVCLCGGHDVDRHPCNFLFCKDVKVIILVLSGSVSGNVI